MTEPAAVPQMTPRDLAALRAQGTEALTLLDVRESWERDLARIEGSLDVPMREVPEAVERLPREGMLAVLCHHGVRSHHVARFLQARGFDNVVNVAGGIDAWARDVDRGIGQY